MMFLIGLLTLVMVVNCFVLVFLVLLQLPKKEAGAGLAFGGAATDALFGAGSGTALTKVTKYAATLFFVLSVALSILQNYESRHGGSGFRKLLAQPSQPAAAPTAHAAPEATTSAAPALTLPAAAPTTLSNLLLSTPTAEATNQPAAPANPAPASPTNNAPASPTPK
jgi:preprotein translocase subunit SecG